MLYLFISGDMMKPSGWLVSIEGHVVMGPHPFFLHGLAAFFSSYYVFNIEYPAAGSSTLEFIQRYFIKITFNLVIHIIVQASNSMIVLRSKMLTNEVPEASLVRPSWSRELIQFRSADQSGFLHVMLTNTCRSNHSYLFCFGAGYVMMISKRLLRNANVLNEVDEIFFQSRTKCSQALFWKGYVCHTFNRVWF